MADGSSVLIVERSGEVRDVLRTALERRGLHVYEASRADAGLKLARRHHPDLIVLDLDEQPDEAGSSDAISRAASASATPIILLGTVRRFAAQQGEFIVKPYHYEPLISRIEQILQARGEGAAANRRAG